MNETTTVNEKEYLSIKDAAQRLDVEYKTVWRLVDSGELPAAKVRGVWRIRHTDLEAFFESRKRQAAGTAVDRCAYCGNRIMSALSVGGRCQTCEAPLCLSCWRIEGHRVCSRHASEDGAAEAAPVHCSRCRQLISSIDMTGGHCEAPGCDAILCMNCCRDPDGHFCDEHRPAEDEKLQEARRRLEQGKIDRLVTGLEAKARELSFVSRFDQKVRQVSTLRDPNTGTVLRLDDVDAYHSTDDDTDRLLEILGVGYLDRDFLGGVPVNVRSRYELPASNGDDVGLVLETMVLSRLEAHAHVGFDTEAMTLSDLMPRLEAAAEEAETTDATYVLGLASTGGWADDAVAYLRGDTQGRSYSHRLLLPYLIDLHAGECFYNELDERLTLLEDFFAPQLPGEEVQSVVDYVLQTMLTSGLSSLTADQVTKALSVAPKVVRQAFEQLSGDGEFTMEDIDGLGLVIARR